MNENFAMASGDQILLRIRGEYLEMPGLGLTLSQARRLWDLDERTCAQLLQSLTEQRFLCRREDGTYVRRSATAMGCPPCEWSKPEALAFLRPLDGPSRVARA